MLLYSLNPQFSTGKTLQLYTNFTFCFSSGGLRPSDPHNTLSPSNVKSWVRLCIWSSGCSRCFAYIRSTWQNQPLTLCNWQGLQLCRDMYKIRSVTWQDYAKRNLPTDAINCYRRSSQDVFASRRRNDCVRTCRGAAPMSCRRWPPHRHQACVHADLTRTCCSPCST